MTQPPEPSPPQEEKDLPIDIDHKKFLPWLVDRRRIPKTYHLHLKSARTLLSQAITQTPTALQTALHLPPPSATTTPIPYTKARQILTTLTSPTTTLPAKPSPEKDLLGRYKSPLLRAWADAIAAFHKNDVFLADCAQVLVRNADLEAPALKANIARLQSEVTEYARRDASVVRAAAEARQRFLDACAEFGLGENVADFQVALREAVERRVPVLLREAVECGKEVAFKEAVEYYRLFAAYVAKEGGCERDVACENVLRVVKGDVAALSRPVRREVVESAEEELELGVDWGIAEVADGEAGDSDVVATEIDWGIEVDATGTADGGGEAVEEKGHVVDGGPVETGDGIDWNEPEVVDVGADDTNDAEEVLEATSDDFSLADPNARELYLNDLIELDAFLTQRLVELSRSGDTEIGLVLQQAADLPDFVKTIDMEKVQQFRESVRRAISAVNSAETRQILALQSDEKRLERAARAILEKKHVAERMHAAIGLLRQRRANAGAELAAEVPKLEQLGRDTREVKKQTEEALSKLYKGRTVNILGEINNVFPPVEGE